MFITLSGADYRNTLTDGLSAYDASYSGYYDWYHRLGGGLWDIYQQFSVAGSTQGVGYTDGVENLIITYYVDGSVVGVGYIESEIITTEAELVSGYVAGAGLVSCKINYSRQSGIFPELRRNYTYSSDDCPIAAFEYVGFSPNKVLSIASNENYFYENTTEYYASETIVKNGSVFPLDHYQWFDSSSGIVNYLVTDFKAEGQNGAPLYYQYELLFDAYSTEDEDLLFLYKNNEVLVKPDMYGVQYSYDLLGPPTSSGRYTSTSWRKFDVTSTIHRVRILLPLACSNVDDYYTVAYKKNLYGAVSRQRELVELQPIYAQGSDYYVNNSILKLTSGSSISSDLLALYVIKDPKDRIKPMGIDPPNYQPDEISSWRLRLNPGSILVNSGEFSGSSNNFYYIGNPYNSSAFPVSNVRPSFVSEAVIKVDQYPVYIDSTSYTYPSYKIDLYDKSTTSLTSNAGKVAIEVNGVSRSDLKITSIDREKGFFMVNTALNPSDEIELSFYVNPTGYLVIDNLELNPKIRGNVSELYITGFYDGLGIALMPYNSGDSSTWYPYAYDISTDESSRTMYGIVPVGSASRTANWVGSGFWTVCEIDVNRLSSEMVKVTDARVVGGGIQDFKALDEWGALESSVTSHEFEWYSEIGYYGGVPLSSASIIVIHIPSGVFFDARDKWIDSMSGILDDPREARDAGIREFNYYTDQVIRRYISAGTEYILIPVDSDGNLMDVVTLDY